MANYCIKCEYWGGDRCLAGDNEPANCLQMLRNLSDDLVKICLEKVK